MAKIEKISIDEDTIVSNLLSLCQQHCFRSAWTFLSNNTDPEHVRFFDAGVVLQHLSNTYGDIILKDDCFLKKELEAQTTRITQLLI